MKGKLLMYWSIYVPSFITGLTCKGQTLKRIRTVLFIYIWVWGVFKMFVGMYMVINVRLYIDCPHGTFSTRADDNIYITLTLPVAEMPS